MEPNYFTCTLGLAESLGLQQHYKNVNAFIDAQAAKSPSAPAVGFAIPASPPDSQWTNLLFTFDEVRTGSIRLATRLVQQHGERLRRRQTIGLICPSTPDFLFMWLALMRLGHSVLLIAPQCQPPAIASLCSTCDAELLFYDDVYETQAKESSRVSSSSQQKGNLEVLRCPFPQNASHADCIGGEEQAIDSFDTTIDENDVAYFHHTSGTSSGMPKPIPQTHRGGLGVLPCFNDGHSAATFTTTPLYHGGVADLFRAWTSGALIWLFPGKGAPITAANIVRCLDVAANIHQGDPSNMPAVKYFSSVPYVLQMMEAHPRGLEYLTSMDIVGVGGAALPPEVGDRLVSRGINLISRFGSAECGFLLSSHRGFSVDKEWQYLRQISPGKDHIRFDAASDGLAELVVESGWPHMAKRNRDDGSFATSDLFEPHPDIANAWRYHSRADSQVTLITGKKFDPAPLEAAIASASDVKEIIDDVLIFANGKPFPGLLLFRKPSARQLSDQDLTKQVWPAIDRLNRDSQDHARIPRAMLVPMPVLETVLEKSSKGTLLRGVVEKRFAKDIENAYGDKIAENAEHVSDEALSTRVMSIVESVVQGKGPLETDTDLFSYGIDSVAGIQIRHRLRHLLPAKDNELPITIVQDCGSVERIATYLLRRRRGEVDDSLNDESNDREYMLELVKQYSTFDSKRISEPTLSNGHAEDGQRGKVIVLTGATGALGAHILEQYLRVPSVSTIYCLVRGADSTAAHERLAKALANRKLTPMDDTRIHVLPSRLGDANLGLSPTIYAQLAAEATTIMHVAWSVNFQLKLRSFVRDNIASVTNLLNLALASPRPTPPTFAFCSSVASALAYTAGPSIPETISNDPGTATSLGYSQSKWVAEQLCARAAAQHPRLRIKVFRVGQLAGDRTHGIWNASEAWPLMLSAVKVTGCLPALENEPLGWLPVDVAAEALVQGTEHGQADDRDGVEKSAVEVYHVLNPHTEPTWTDMLAWLRKQETFETVAPAEWVAALERVASDPNTAQHPAVKLLGHWKRAFGERPRDASIVDDKSLNATTERNGEKGDDEAKPALSFDMHRTRMAIPCLQDVRPVDEEVFGKLWTWIRDEM